MASVASVVSSSDSGVAGRNTGTIVRLDAFVATTFTCLCVDCSETVGSRRKKLYYESILEFLPIAFAQLTHQIGAYVNNLGRKRADSFFSLNTRTTKCSVMSIPAEATLKEYIPYLNSSHDALSSEQLLEYINPYMDNIHDFYHPEFDSTMHELVPFGAHSNLTDMDLDL